MATSILTYPEIINALQGKNTLKFLNRLTDQTITQNELSRPS